MSLYPQSLDRLISNFSRFPGIGKKSAERLAFYILKNTTKDAKELSESIIDLKEKISFCNSCFYISDNGLCQICNNPKRNSKLICVVETFKDVISIEKTLDYKGVYHVLMGHISPHENIGPNQLTIKELINRIDNNLVEELIFATNPNMAGDTTALYIANEIKNYNIKLTRIARGLPVGSDLEFADPITLSKSMSKREDFSI